MADIFLSYAAEDRDRVRPLVELLERQGWTVWWDREIHAGPRFDQVIEEALDRASCVVVVWSSQSVQSDWVHAEASEGLERGILVPVRLDDVRLPLGFRRSQTADLVGFPRNRQGLGVLLSGVRDTLRKTKPADAVEAPAAEPGQGNEAARSRAYRYLVGGGVAALVTAVVWFGWDFAEGERNHEAALAPIRSIAVLPLQNLSGDDEQEYFADGTTDLLIQDLGKVSAFHRVISRVSVMRFKGTTKPALEIADELGVDGLLTGTVARTADRVRIALQLYDAREDRNVWAERYERPLSDIFALQTDVARAVADELGIELSKHEINSLSRPTVDPASYEAYLLGRNYASRRMDSQAVLMLETAIDLDAANADAYAELGRIKVNEAWEGAPPRQVYQQVRHYIDAALAHDSSSVHALALQAYLRFFDDLAYQDAVDQFAELLNSNPSNPDLLRWYAHALQMIDRIDLALRLAKRRVEIDPFDPATHVGLGDKYQFAGLHAEAQQSYQRAESLGSTQLALYLAGVAYGMRDRSALEAQLARDREDWGVNSRFIPLFQAFLARLEGDEQEVLQIVKLRDAGERAEFWWPEYFFASLVRDTDRALTYFAHAVDRREPLALQWIHGSVLERREWLEMYEHPGYKSLLRQVGLDRESLKAIRVPPFPSALGEAS
jgi:TolB-like protein